MRLSFKLKPVDSHQYLHYNSCHAQHIKKSIIYSQTLRLRRIYPGIKDIKSHVKNLKGWFLRRGYSQRIVEEQMDRAFRTSFKKWYPEKQNWKWYNSAFRNLSTTLRKNFNKYCLLRCGGYNSFYAKSICCL